MRLFICAVKSWGGLKKSRPVEDRFFDDLAFGVERVHEDGVDFLGRQELCKRYPKEDLNL